MAGGFGYELPQSQPAAGRPEQVGRSLMLRGQMAREAPAPSMMAPVMPDPMTEGQMLRQAGAQRTGGPGQIDTPADEDGAHSPNAINIAVGEALTRLGGGYKTNPNPLKPHGRNVAQLMQLGLSPTEAQLMVQTGGV